MDAAVLRWPGDGERCPTLHFGDGDLDCLDFPVLHFGDGDLDCLPAPPLGDDESSFLFDNGE